MDLKIDFITPSYYYLNQIFDKDILKKREVIEIQNLIKQNTLISVNNNDHLCGISIINNSEFDTEILGIKTAKILKLATRNDSCKDKLLKDSINHLIIHNYKYASVRIPLDYDWVHRLENCGFRLTDVICFLYTDTTSVIKLIHSYEIRPAKVEDTQKMLDIADNAFVYGRFFQDNEIPKDKANNIYKNWVINSVNRTVCNEIFILSDNNNPIGFISIKDLTNIESPQISLASIELLVVNRNYRGKGISKILINEALGYCQSKHIRITLVDTQITNLPALRSYLSSGFQFGQTYTTLRLFL
jgi:ribosomal protein S18 acetylase RimI-like enzyme